MGNRDKDGKGHHTMVVGSRSPLNQVQNEGNPNIPKRNAGFSNQVQKERNPKLSRRNVGSSNQGQDKGNPIIPRHNVGICFD